jgi:hypothetical protein
MATPLLVEIDLDTTVLPAGRWNMRLQKKARSARRAAEDGGDAFIHDFRHGFVPIADGDVEAFGEEFVAGATSNEPIGEVARDEVYAADVGGVAFVFNDEDELDRAEFF